MTTLSLWIVDLLLTTVPYFYSCEKPRSGPITSHDYTVIVVAYNGYSPTYLGEDEENVVFALSGTTKTESLRETLKLVKTPFVVCLDGDTVPGGDLRMAVQPLADVGADLASVKVLPTPLDGGLLERLQNIEYSIAMRARRWSPWLVSGAMFIARTDSLRKILEEHSGDFDGEDLEIGLIAKKNNMKVVHVDFPAYTDVPRGLGKLVSQRIRWFRGFVKLSTRYRFLPAFIPHILYWWIPFVLMTPFKILSLDTSITPFIILYIIYLSITLIAKPPKTLYIVLFPIYSLFQSIVIPIASTIHSIYMVFRKIF